MAKNRSCSSCGSHDVIPAYPKGVHCNACGRMTDGTGKMSRNGREDDAIADVYDHMERGD